MIFVDVEISDEISVTFVAKLAGMALDTVNSMELLQKEKKLEIYSIKYAIVINFEHVKEQTNSVEIRFFRTVSFHFGKLSKRQAFTFLFHYLFEHSVCIQCCLPNFY